jgi:hypothetical protein
MIENGFVRATVCSARQTLSQMSSRLCMLLIATFVWGVGAIADAQTQIPLPAQTGTFSGNSRGYWFTAPTNFVITAVQVPTEASSGNQNIAVLRLTAAPPLFSATTDVFTQLFLTQNNASVGALPTRIAVSQNDVIGVLGDRGGVNSYASGAPHASTIDGQAVSLGRFGMQFPLTTTAPQQVWQEAGGSISRVFFEYQAGFLISAAASPPEGGSVTCTPDIVASGATTTCTVAANPGYVVSTVSGCGVTATAPPYTTSLASAHCTVAANFAPGVTVGGTVGGLSGTGLVLSLNGTETLPIAADGAFTFASAVNTGSAYNVTVQTQPSAPSQTCTVANGSGTAGASNINDVTVTCTTNTYTVGGNVSGLSGSGLVLSLNSGAQTFNVSANGSFVFPTGLASGSAYAVTVQTQPSAPTQTCTVGSGSGSVTNANVSDVSVTCSTDTYTVGGTVSGLTGTGFVLSLNSGAQTLAIGADGGFTFPTAIASGSAYAVSVQTQPSAPAQTCGVSNGTGTIASSNVTNMAVQCALQQRAVSLSSTFGNISTSPPIPSSVADGTVLSLSLNVPVGYALLSVSGCGGTLSGTTYTTAPITADCAISVNLAAAAVEAVPTLNGASLVMLSILLLGIAASNRRRTR